MIALLHDLYQHKGYANAALLKAIHLHEPAAQDLELHRLLHHIVLANRFWFSLMVGRPFLEEQESRIPESLQAIAAEFHETTFEELEWMARLAESDLDRMLETPYMPGQQYSVAEAVMQVCMHSHGHRAQCATRLRTLGGTPPAMDFVQWLRSRSAPDWLWLRQ